MLAYAAYVPASRLVAARGWPAPLALFATMLVVLLPCELALLARARRSAHRHGLEVIPYRRRLPIARYAAIVLPLVAWAFVCFFWLAPGEERLVKAAFSWRPPAWAVSVDSGGGSRPAWIATMLFGLVVNGVAVPVVEELYFRGYLQPRIPLGRRWSPLAGAALFSLYHFFSPWQNLSRTLAVAPIAYAVARRRSVLVGILAHVLLNTIAMSVALASLLR